MIASIDLSMFCTYCITIIWDIKVTNWFYFKFFSYETYFLELYFGHRKNFIQTKQRKIISSDQWVYLTFWTHVCTFCCEAVNKSFIYDVPFEMQRKIIKPIKENKDSYRFCLRNFVIHFYFVYNQFFFFHTIQCYDIFPPLNFNIGVTFSFLL